MTRVWSGVALALLAVVVVWWAAGWLFFLVAEALLLLACHEYRTLNPTRDHGVPFPVWAGGAACTCAALAAPAASVPHVVALLLVTLIAVGTFAVFGWRGGDALSGVASATFPALYLGLPIGVLILVRAVHRPAGLFLLMLTVMASDTAQYYTGRALGRRPLAPAISPKKTVEGAIGGLVVGSAVFAVLAASWLDRPDWSLMVRVGLGVVIVAVGIIGDLFESMLKRSAGVKDSSALIPGHGGVLDRIDALLFAAPVYFLALTYL